MAKNYFQTWEVVPWEVWLALGENARNLVSGRIIHGANLLRAALGLPMICNTKGYGGRNESGLRTPDCKHYKSTSQHAGNHNGSIDGNRSTALDFACRCDPRKYHAEILKNPDKYDMIRFVEIDISWLHIDAREHTSNFALWSPKRGFVDIDVYVQELKENGFW